MKTYEVLLLGVVAVLLSVSVIIAQAAFRLDRTVLSYGFMNRETQAWIDPLDDAALHAQTIESAYREARRATGLAIPRDMDPYVVRAAAEAFSVRMIRHTIASWWIEIHRGIRGELARTELFLPLSPFKNALLSELRTGLSADEVRAATAALNTIPASFDVLEILPAPVERRVVAALRRSSFVSFLFQYVFPGVLIIACFFHRRIGLGVLAVGVAFLAAGIPSVAATFLHAETAARWVSTSLAGVLPQYLSWLREGIATTVRSIIVSGRTTSLVVTASGIAMMLLGGYTILMKRDITIGE